MIPFLFLAQESKKVNAKSLLISNKPGLGGAAGHPLFYV